MGSVETIPKGSRVSIGTVLEVESLDEIVHAHGMVNHGVKCNTSYGVTLNKYNDMYDPRQGRMICIYGQLFLTDLMGGLMLNCPSFEMVNFNTDGLIYEIDEKDVPTMLDIIKEWEERTGFVLEGHRIKQMVQKDVNNYCMIEDNGYIVTKGGMVKNYGGGDIVSNSLVVVQNALVDYLLKGIPVEETINNETNILNFQMIAKTGRTYLATYHVINGEKVEVQKVNRVYATKDEKYGTIYKFKLDKNGKERYDKITNLPNHSIIDNNNQLSIEDIDKQFYIDMVNRRIKQFIGE